MPSASVISVITSSISLMTRAPTLSMRSVVLMWREIGFVDLFEIGFGQLAVARQRLVDDLVERRIVAGRVDVPDFVIARHCGLPKRFDLAQRDFGERHGAFVFVQQLDH